jgi:RimJ/RimL family protein N-acetyltransferase
MDKELNSLVNFRYIVNPNTAELNKAADLIDSGGQLAEKLDREKFKRSGAIVVAFNQENAVVGVAAIKEPQGDVAEIGYLIVDLDFRRRGIAQELTKRRIDAAKEKGLRLLFTNVRRNNTESIGNLKKADFRHWGDFMSAYQTNRVISWFFYPLATDVDWRSHMERLTQYLKPSSIEQSSE